MILIAGWYILVLCAASVMDIKTRKIPVELPFFLCSIQAGYYGMALHKGTLHSSECITAVLCALIIFVMCYFCMLFGNLGGSDTLFFTAIGLHLSVYAFYTVLISFSVALPYCYIIHKKKKSADYPFLPYITIGYILTLIIVYFADIKSIF